MDFAYTQFASGLKIQSVVLCKSKRCSPNTAKLLFFEKLIDFYQVAEIFSIFSTAICRMTKHSADLRM